MGKKRIIKQSEAEVLKETERQESAERKAAQEVKKSKKDKLKSLPRAHIYIQSTYNNTLITLTDPRGRVVAWVSAGSVGFKGPRKATPFAASKIVDTLMEKVRGLNIREAAIFVKGIGSGRESAIRTLANYNMEIIKIKDVTPIPHNGCRPPKPRRL